MTKFSSHLKSLKEQNRYRSLNLPNGIDFTSNDYLGMSQHPALRDAALEALNNNIPIGAAGSRLLRGQTQAHQNLEDFSAAYFKAGKTLFFTTGFQANYAIFTTLPDRHDIILYDSLIHASVRDGVQASPAKSFKFSHNDLNALEHLLKQHEGKTIWVAIESLYSMDGDIAPLEKIYALVRQYNSTLIVDEAHSTGIYGTQGKGLCWNIIDKDGYDHLITLHTCGKAVGVAGGLVCASNQIIDYLINRARPFIFSTACIPLQAYLVQKSFEILGGEDGEVRRRKLSDVCVLGQKLFGGDGTHIIPIILGDDEKAVRISNELQNKGYDIRAIRPPTVPEGTSRLRLSLSSTLDASILQDFGSALKLSVEQESK